MAFIDANVPLNRADKISPSRSCEKCAAEMTHLSDLPPFLGRASVRVFRCYRCDRVVSEDW